METMAFYRGTYYSPSVGMDREVNVLVPNDVGEDERLKTLYLLHGYYGNHQQWIRYTSIERYAAQKRLMVVMPEAQNGFYINHAYGLAHFDALMDLMHHVERLFPVSKEREDRYVAGLSMGGYGALKWALTNPDLFSKAASLSGALDLQSVKESIHEEAPQLALGMFGETEHIQEEDDLTHLFKHVRSQKKPLPDVHLSCGTDDYLYEENVIFKAFLEQNNIPFTYVEVPGKHTWDFWDMMIQKVLDWL